MSDDNFETSKHQSTNSGGNVPISDVGTNKANAAGIDNVYAGNGVGANGSGNAGNGVGTNGNGAAPPPADIFSDLSALSMSQAYADIVGVKKLLLMVPVKKPHSQQFVRVHPTFRIPAAPVITLKDDGESFLLTPAVAAQLSTSDFAMVDLFLAISRQNVLFVWPVPVPAEGRRANTWHTSGRDAAVRATAEWVKVTANHELKGYEVTVPPPLVKIPEPVWPTDKTFNEILRIAFKDRVIETVDHPLIKRLLTGA
jgi:hypothetical protein